MKQSLEKKAVKLKVVIVITTIIIQTLYGEQHCDDSGYGGDSGRAVYIANQVKSLSTLSLSR